MSTKNSKTPPGIAPRHSKRCMSRQGQRCDCAPTWQAWVWDPRARAKIKTTRATKTEAKLWRQDALVAVRGGELRAGPAPGAGTVAAALDELVDGMRAGIVLDRSGRRYRPVTIRGYASDIRTTLTPALGHLRVAEVRRSDIQRLVDRLHADGLSGSTIRNKLDPLKVLYRRALEDEDVRVNPTTTLRYPAKPKTAKQIAAPDRAKLLLDELPDDQRAMWATAFYAGLRMGELRALRWRDVDFDGGAIAVRSGWDDVEGEQDPKTEAGIRSVPLVGRLRAELARHKLATGRAHDDLCFGETPTTAPVRSTVRARALRAWGWKHVPNPDRSARPKEIWIKAHDAALEPLSPHEARHTCASYLAAAGLTHKEVQTAMGHADIRTTLNLYAKAVPGWERAAAAKVDTWLEEASAGQRGPVAGQSGPEPGRS